MLLLKKTATTVRMRARCGWVWRKVHVAGHAGINGNEQADRLAKLGAAALG